MQIPDYVVQQIQGIIQNASLSNIKRNSNPLESTLSTAAGQTDFLRERMYKGLNLNPELEAKFQQMIDISDNPESNPYLSQIMAALEETQKGQNFDEDG